MSWFHQKEQFSATAPLPPRPTASVPPRRPTRRSRSDKASEAGQPGGVSPSTRKRGGARPLRPRSQGVLRRAYSSNPPPPHPPLPPGTQVLASGGFGRPDSGRLGGYDEDRRPPARLPTQPGARARVRARLLAQSTRSRAVALSKSSGYF